MTYYSVRDKALVALGEQETLAIIADITGAVAQAPR